MKKVEQIHKQGVIAPSPTADILKFVQSRLQNNLKYNNAYEIEKTMNLVKER
jgi:hypothetical protein